MINDTKKGIRINPNKDTWQERAKILNNPMLDVEKAREIKKGLQLVNIKCVICEGYPDGNYGSCGKCNRMIARSPSPKKKERKIKALDVKKIGEPRATNIDGIGWVRKDLKELAEKVNEIIDLLSTKQE